VAPVGISALTSDAQGLQVEVQANSEAWTEHDELEDDGLHDGAGDDEFEELVEGW
jgi:hypothetical protein